MSKLPGKKVTIRDVAKVAGVSVTTVSHALNGRGRIEAETIARVKEAAERLGYRASQAARNLRGGRSGRIAIINSQSSPHQVSLVDLEHFVRLLSGASEFAVEHGYTPVLTLPASQGQGAQVDGVIIVDPVKGEPLIGALRLAGIPVVTTGRDPSQRREDEHWVDNDLYRATLEMLDHLAAQGAKRVDLLAASSIYSYSEDAIRAYRDWSAQKGLQARMHEVEGPLSENGAYLTSLPLLQSAERPDALHCVTDRYAFGVMLAAQSLGLKLPGDLLLSAGTDSDLAANHQPPLTALTLSPEQIGREAAQLLIDLIEGAGGEPHRVVPYSLQVRATTAG